MAWRRRVHGTRLGHSLQCLTTRNSPKPARPTGAMGGSRRTPAAHQRATKAQQSLNDEDQLADDVAHQAFSFNQKITRDKAGMATAAIVDATARSKRKRSRQPTTLDDETTRTPLPPPRAQRRWRLACRAKPAALLLSGERAGAVGSRTGEHMAEPATESPKSPHMPDLCPPSEQYGSPARGAHARCAPPFDII